ncbi:MAG: PHP domain-containing protein [Clostridia bacterium]|nr:PHP domain-containing protein [Clostridia bacterium]MDD4145633.1 PHP domain-containing protein [Clostridia bacterium]
MSCNKSYQKNNLAYKADLHVHTTASDGAYSPREIVNLAREKGISFLAITDHDTTAGLAEAAQECRRCQLAFFPGIELSTIYEEQEVHILGYNINWANERMREMVSQLQNARNTRIEKMVIKLSELGFSLDFEDVRKKSSAQNLGRVHLALVLIDKGIVSSINEAFTKYLNPGCPTFVPRYKLTPFLALKIIKEAEGVSVLAHPGLACCDELIPVLVKKGLQGIEAFHPRHTKEDEILYFKKAQEYKLLITGGSDFHGHEEKDLDNLGEMEVPFDSIRQLKKRMGSIF